MPSEITKPDAEAKVIASAQTKQPPAIPTTPTQVDPGPVRTIDPAKLQAVAAAKSANDAIDTCGDVTGDLRVAVSGLATATKYLNIANAKLAGAPPKA